MHNTAPIMKTYLTPNVSNSKKPCSKLVLLQRWSMERHLYHLGAMLDMLNHKPQCSPSELEILRLWPRSMCFTTSPGPSYTFKWQNPCSKMPGSSVSRCAGHIDVFLLIFKLLNTSFSSGNQKGKVWHILGTSVTHGEICAVTNPGTTPSWKFRKVLLLLFSLPK
jgi:hypothetical protein